MMKLILKISIFCCVIFSFGYSQNKQDKSIKNEAVATFAQGCFWHSELVFQSLVGVRDAVSGYAGGKSINPTYEEVSSGETGHAECVQVFYDPQKIAFKTLVMAYFFSMDPTKLNQQGNDIGTQYRSIVFYRNEEERKIIEEVIQSVNASKKFKSKIIAEILPFTAFYPAEKYHQEYIKNNPANPYVKNVCYPEYLHFRKTFKGVFKE